MLLMKLATKMAQLALGSLSAEASIMNAGDKLVARARCEPRAALPALPWRPWRRLGGLGPKEPARWKSCHGALLARNSATPKTALADPAQVPRAA